MSWKIAVGLTLVAVAPISAQRTDRHRPVRVDIPPIIVDVPRVKVDVPPVNVVVPPVNVDIPSFDFKMPAINVDIPSFNFSMPQFNLDIPAIHIDLSGITEAVETSVRASLDALNDIDFYATTDAYQVSHVKSLMRDWRAAVRRAQDTGDWQEADDIARELSRAADRMGKPDVRVIRHSNHKNPRS